MFYSVDFLKTSSPGDSNSNNSDTAPKSQAGKQRYTEVFATKDLVVSLNEKIPDISN